MGETINVLLVIGAFILAGITLLGVLLSNHNTQKSNRHTEESNRLYRLELTERFKPILDVEEPMVINPAPNGPFFNPKIANKGMIPVYDITVNYVVLHRRYEIDEIILNEEFIKQTKIEDEGTLFPNLIFNSVRIPLTEEDIHQPTLIIILWMEFEYLNDIKEEQIFAVNFTNGRNTGFGNYTGHDIDKSRKRIKEKLHL